MEMRECNYIIAKYRIWPCALQPLDVVGVVIVGAAIALPTCRDCAAVHDLSQSLVWIGFVLIGFNLGYLLYGREHDWPKSSSAVEARREHEGAANPPSEEATEAQHNGVR